MTLPTDQSLSPEPRTRLLRAAIEVVVLSGAVLSPWAFAAVHPVAVFGLFVLVALALTLWALALLTEQRFAGRVCPVLVCLAGLVAVGVWQLVPLGPAVLSALAPATADARAALVPAEPESLTGEAPVVEPARISFDPGATRREVAKLLAVMALFAVVRYAVATPSSYRRFAVVCVANGVALSVFALAQRFSSGPQTVYWSFETQGSVFGPFVCKNHFPYYVNVCFGLGLGLLLGGRAFRERTVGLSERLAALGREPKTLWLLAALGLMLAANLYSLSRGGVVALVGAGVVCAALAALTGRRGGGAGGAVPVVALIALCAAGLVGWFGTDAVSKRLGTLDGTDALDAGRRDLWSRAVPLAAKYPVWGTGQGTFVSVEPQQRHPGDTQLVTWEHAHNDYLEALVEGGLVQFVLVLLVAALVFRAGVRAVRSAGTRADAALRLGGLFGITAVALHSLADFGLHMPAIVLLVTVLAAHLTAAESLGATRADGPAPPRWVVLPIAAWCVLVAVVLPAEGWRRARAEYYRLAAIRAEKRLPAGERGVVVGYLGAAVAYSPDDADLWLRLADVRYEEYLALRDRVPDAEREYLRPALRDYLRVRALNPLLERPHVRLAGGRAHLTNAAPTAVYLDRAAALRPSDAGLWYLAGLAHLNAGEDDRAWECWGRSLVCSDAQLEGIVTAAAPRLGGAGLLDRVLPPDPKLLVAASRLPVLAERPADRVALLDRAGQLLEAAGDPEGAYLRARVLLDAGRPADALRAYERAVLKAPGRVGWRFELAELCFEQGQLEPAAEHLRQVLRDQPDWPGARDLSAAVVRARAGLR
ncbi:O-antigen ligase family protein [Gemmata sp. JC717]|uniref:O-antigen ligase family protein n=1 Tax=Gemmata algarum TaxID=2975278 RepID=A0ABU5EST2_9BACT|nr:O-antigen ligase family protein [Gemmata algarum]MDY3552155.1 O-antigen ligase family protein [Gemmata algarum]MDY3558309.1 O-antigen ligase family protein [Gemmata algarum]